MVERQVAQGQNRDVAVRIYTARLLGKDPTLVLHSGGSVSVKTTLADADGSEVEVLRVTASGVDMRTIEPSGLPAVRLQALKQMAAFDRLSDEQVVMLQRRLLMDPSAPNPSIEAILHADLPFQYVDHTQANAIVSLTNQPDGEALVRELFPDSIIVPYVMPGLDLAKAIHAAFLRQPKGDGIVILKHGIVTYSDDPQRSYEDMIAKVDRAERRLAQGRAHPFKGAASPPGRTLSPADIAPILRGAIASDTGVEGQRLRMALVYRTSEAIRRLADAENARSLVSRGNAAPEHAIHIKRKGLALPSPTTDLASYKCLVKDAVAEYVADYKSYFERNNTRTGGAKVMLDPHPKVFYVASVGLFAAGTTAKNAHIAADLAEATVDVITKAEGVGGWEPLPEADLFNIEYRSLEQAKLAEAAEKPLTRQVAVVTGAAGGLGLAVAEALRAEGAELALLDINEEKLLTASKRLEALALPCDVTDPKAVDAAIDQVAVAYGGLDIVVSNAGAAFLGRMQDVPDAVMQKAFALNFDSHHYVARAAVRVMERQGTGGALLFNVSTQAVNPGLEFGPYGTSKAALLALMRQYAIEAGPLGITSNAVNAAHVRSGLMTDEIVDARSKARGVTPEVYMRGNLLRREVLASDVAAAFVHLAKARASSGAVLNVDGGNVASMMR